MNLCRLFIVFALAMLPFYATAQKKELSPDALKVKKHYDYLARDQRAELNKIDFVTAFPKDKETFLRVFYPYELDELYDYRKDYLDMLKSIGELYPREVLGKSIVIGKDLRGSEDIVGQLQNIIIDLGNRHPAKFIAEANKLKKTEVSSLAAFLADADNKNYPLFLVLGEQIKGMGDTKLAAAFEKAAKEKEKQSQ